MTIDQLRNVMAVLAFTFHWSLADMRAMPVDDLLDFHERAVSLQKARAKSGSSQ